MWKFRIGVLFSIVAAGLLAFTSVKAREEHDISVSDRNDEIIIVELFTSQGCSSCPPADRLLRRLVEEESSNVLPLAFHVDYWNYIGWTDPFSSAQWSERQSRYARKVFQTSRVYTPQLVVNGRTDCVGSNERLVRKNIAEARKRPAMGRLEVGLEEESTADRLALAIDAAVRESREGESAEWDVMVAVFEDHLVTPVPRGENSGRTLKNSRVVRSLEKAFSISASAGNERSEVFEVTLDPLWDRSRLGVAVFLQDPASMHIHGAAVRDRLEIR